MTNLPPLIMSDGKVLGEKFFAANEVLSAGELNYQDFSSPLVRKVVYLQYVFSQDGVEERYDLDKVREVRSKARHFLTSLMDGGLTEAECTDLNKRLSTLFPRMALGKPLKK